MNKDEYTYKLSTEESDYKRNDFKMLEGIEYMNEEWYSSLFYKNHSIMLIVDPDTGYIVDANPAACSFYGYRKEELLNMKISDINVLESEHMFVQMEYARTFSSTTFYFRHKLADGSIRDVEVYSGPIWIDGKQMLYSIVHDISERRKMERELVESEERYRSLIELSPDAVFVHSEGKFLFTNKQGVKILKLDKPEDLIGRSIEEFTHSEYRNLNVQRAKIVQTDGQKLSLTEQKIYRNDGSVIDVEIAAASLIYQGKKSVQSVVRDITERKKELERAASIQMHRLNTSFPLEDRAVLESIYMPSKTVSGDFYQLYKINDHLVVGMIGDVSGKGITAALNVTALKVLFGDGVLINTEPSSILKYLNRQVSKHLEEDYIAACCFSFDFKHMKATVAGAGINQFIYSNQVDKWMESTVKGPFLGMFEDSIFEQQVIEFKSGDKFYFYTDGLDFIFEDSEYKKKCMNKRSVTLLKKYIKDNLNNMMSLSDDCTWLGIEIK